jgi:thiosulfate/3-mercaptopyruvate sulfurtransferase
LLDGGYSAWKATGAIPEQTVSPPAVSSYDSTFHAERLATVDTLRDSLNDTHCQLLDTRSAGEYQGTVVRALRGGHIPSAVNIDWTEAMTANRLLKSRAALTELYTAKGITPDHEIVTYCHSHHRSAHTYFVLKWLGFPHVRGYAGSWSEWGNHNDTPVA